LRFFDFTGRDALLSAWPAGRFETAALAADFVLAVAVAFILTALVPSTASSDCLGFGVGGAAVGGYCSRGDHGAVKMRNIRPYKNTAKR
jgi:hypothetical protein